MKPDSEPSIGPPAIVIVLSTYNGERFLHQQITSLQQQTETHWQLLVRDDGSTDSTVSQLRIFATQDERIVFVDDGGENKGVTQSYSSLIQLGKDLNPDYLMFCDQDDLWQPDKIALTLRHMHEQETMHRGAPVLVHTDLSVVDESGDLLHASMWAFARIDPALNQLSRLLLQNTVTGCTAMINRVLLRLLKPMPAEALLHDWWVALVAAAFGHVSPLAISTIHYRQHGNNVAGVREARHWSHALQSFFSRESDASFHALRKQLVLLPAEQSRALADAYSTRLSVAQQQLLHSFANVAKLPWHSRRLLLIRHRLLRQRNQHNLSLMLLA